MKSMYERATKVMPPVANRATTLGVINSEDYYLYTEDGRKILDFASGVAVNNLGNKNKKVVEAVKEQLNTMIHVGHNVVYYESYVALAEKLVELTGGDTMVYFSNSGAEVNEGALKLAKYITGRPGIISFKNSFHGRTIGCCSITGSSSAYRKYYEPLMPGVYWADYANCYRCPFGKEKCHCNMECLKQFDSIFHKLIDPACIAAMIVEPVQGEGGYIVPPKEFLQGLRRICDKHGILLIYDEIQTGIGRTGELFAYQTFDVKPDILTSAKALSGGIPLAALIAKKEFMRKWPAGAHGGTFGGNPLACAAALKTLEIIEEENLLDNCKTMGKYLMESLYSLQEKYTDIIGEVRGIGLMCGIEFVDEQGNPDGELASYIKKKALEEGLLLLTCGSDHNVVRFIAPLTVTEKEIDQAVLIIDKVIAEK
ncbi:aspartate aminotransferase family protein [Anaerosacchariphilus polymeriproducens]|uniref:(S)-3-amino-2-methylpropionate transaminase n=1 Tax=Anaerosacchariphilus polymeriproducens TaxID=1812858 RepID=A0A371AZS1_9FIRM|nr:aspartate aminotransferase family protein [Anaerosacchariphilus polymeriproducens]RDU25061.1 aminotransferase class III-fold pyridoxal phosphate-dependent enzyme [Anaerosacchariphilus polymeriproducens]